MDSNTIRHIDRIEVKVDFIQVGTTLSGNVYDEGNHLLFKSHVPFTREMIVELKSKGIKSVYYTPANEILFNEQAKDIEQFRGRAGDLMNMMMESIKNNDRPDIESTKKFIRDLQRYSDINDNTYLQLMKIREHDDYTFTHSVNVGILTMLMAKKNGAGSELTREIGLGAVLHDIGKLAVPLEILNKKDKLLDKEVEVLRTHSQKGYDFLKQYYDISEEALAIVGQHHEWYDGKGYPGGINDEQIKTGAKYTALCDVYDALTTERPYKRAYEPREAMVFIMQESGGHFNPLITTRFIKEMTPMLMDEPIFPYETLVLLNTGEVAMVQEAHSIGDERPIVSIITDRNRKKLTRYFDVDLTMDGDRRIKRVVRFPQV